MLTYLMNFLFIIAAVILGLYILIAGRRYLWATTGIVSLVATANLLAILVAGQETGRDLVDSGNWQLLLIALSAGIIGGLLGRFQQTAASAVVGFVAGADITIWGYEIMIYISERIAGLSESTTLWIGIVLLLVGGVIGVYLTLKYPRRAMVLISVIIGVEIIYAALNLNPSSSITAVVLLSLALVGMVVQYAEYARQTQMNLPVGVALNPIDASLELEE